LLVFTNNINLFYSCQIIAIFFSTKIEMIQKQFADKAVEALKDDNFVTGLTAGGSWITNELDEYSDLDLILVTKESISGNKEKMLEYAGRIGKLLSGFTGEHVGEPRVLICLYDDPLLHVDIKFLTIEEFHSRVETPVILLDRNGELQNAIDNSEAKFPLPGYQWLEDRFWIWVHYALMKIQRGEYLEALDFLAYLRATVFGPLLHIANGSLPRGVRKVETGLPAGDLKMLQSTIGGYNKELLTEALKNAVRLYRILREKLFKDDVVLRSETEKAVMKYWVEVNEFHR
jgi:predicted nucleotidyltransferase